MSGMPEPECWQIRVAGYLHDVGKLAIPKEIIEKGGKLNEEEFNTLKSHPYHTFRTLENIKGLEVINEWASFHHERLDGSGYPFCLKSKELSLGSRIVSIADVFTAIMEDRPYRPGMAPERALEVLKKDASEKSLDWGLVELLEENFDVLNTMRKDSQVEELKEFQEFYRLAEFAG